MTGIEALHELYRTGKIVTYRISVGFDKKNQFVAKKNQFVAMVLLPPGSRKGLDRVTSYIGQGTDLTAEVMDKTLRELAETVAEQTS